MNRLLRPSFFDDHAALEALAKNKRAASHPHLLGHVPAIRAGYAQYVAANGDAHAIASVVLPPEIETYLRGHYGSPPKAVAYIDEIRSRGGVAVCPMCGSMGSGTLDHVLPKTSHAAFAIFGLNLVPACKCNSLRSTALTGPNPGERVLHPYFDDILGQRLLAGRFEDLGPAPQVSLRILLPAGHALLPAVRFHVENVVERTQVRDYLRRSWCRLIGGPGRTTVELRSDPPTRDALAEIFTRELERCDAAYDGPNNWDSLFMMAILEDHVVDWLFDRFCRPGRAAGEALLV